MSTQRIQTLMERLRIQSIIQRLIKSQGREQALATVLAAIDLEFPEQISTVNETCTKRDQKNIHTRQ